MFDDPISSSFEAVPIRYGILRPVVKFEFLNNDNCINNNDNIIIVTVNVN